MGACPPWAWISGMSVPGDMMTLGRSLNRETAMQGHHWIWYLLPPALPPYINYNVEVSLPFWPWSISISYASTGSTICLCQWTHHFADYDERFELSENTKDWFCKGKHLFQFFQLFLTMITVGWNFQCWKSKGNAWWHRQIVFLEGIKKNRKLKVISTGAWICYHPSSWDWCTLLLSLPLGWGFTFPCLYADFLLRWDYFWADPPPPRSFQENQS